MKAKIMMGCGFKFIRDNEVRAQNVIWNLSDEVSKHGSAPELENLKKQVESTKDKEDV